MGIVARLKTGFGMARRSVRVLRAHPRLLAFPLLGGISGVAFVATLFGGLFVTGSLLRDPGPALFGALFVAYLVETFVASFFSASLVAATREAFHGNDPRVRAALATAWNRKRTLLAWSLIAAVVGVLIKAIESQDNLVGQLVAGLFTVAWSVMTYFVVPVIVFREPSVRELFEESAGTFKDTWGESIGAMGTVDIATVLLAVLGAGLGAVMFVATAGLGDLQLAATALVGGTAVVFALVAGKAISGVAKTALYVYATEQTAPEHFDDMDFGDMGGTGSSRSASWLNSR
jgi:hypothetical protein